MRKNLFFVLILMVFFDYANAQTVRPGVLVIGNGNAAVAAGLQSAISGVKTTILVQAGGFDISPIEADLSSGIQATFSKKYNAFLNKNGGKQSAEFDKQVANNVLTAWADSIKNLTIIKNVQWVKAERSGNNWSFKLSDGSTIKPKVFINPGDVKLNEALKIEVKSTRNWMELAYNTTVYRTSVAAGKSVNGTNATIFSLYDFFIPQQENLVWINDSHSMILGQAAGATAAYSAFYDTKTSLSNLKKIQGELINYKLNLMPFADIKTIDTNWKAIQMVGVTGILKADVNETTASFSPDKLVTTEEIKQPIKDFYYKAQIWFDDYKNPQITIGSALEMICYVGNKSLENTKKEIAKKWKTTYQFKTELDLNRQINRRELAVLLQDYMPPFNVNIDQNGKVVR
ncbi:hypothetical protein GM921_11980 [Pedobacter sp. LMG 31464]|uniref:FAD dependent oxidoreductase n=1 Tax=Pedobacter planticolens TaxID=2679964 RepID=A0A923DY50_9SPHI|nr:hypothetical protein [Pedobacter planticolens]MBB2146209.1 hypothetical protein [Pedobacter planticolens]